MLGAVIDRVYPSWEADFCNIFSRLSADRKELVSEQWGIFEALRFHT